MKKQLLSLVLLCLLGNVAMSQCMMAPISITSRITNSDVIIEGKVIQQEAYKESGTNLIFTSNLIEVYKIFKGVTSYDSVEVITEGGMIGDEMQTVEPSLNLSIGDMGIFTLNQISQSKLFNSSKAVCKAYASAQGFIRYNQDQSAATDVFNTYTHISRDVYNAVTDVTGGLYVTLKPLPAIAEKSIGSGVGVTAVSLTSFTPTSITAGTFSTLTINGSGFGATRGTNFVQFANADDGGATYITVHASQYVLWSDTQIKVVVPSVTSMSGTAGTGKIAVNIGGVQTLSSTNLTVNYGQMNIYSATPNIMFNTQHINQSSGGYVWTYNAAFITNAPAKAAFERAFTTWRCATFIDWQLASGTSTLTAAASDGVNLITFETGMPAGVLGRCTSYWSGCGSGTAQKWYVSELDISFAPTPGGLTWQYGPAAPTTSQYDFESVAVHELGHGHQLTHVINSLDLMHYALSNGQQKRALNTDDLNGATAVMTRNLAGGVCSKPVMIALTSTNCALGAPTADFSASRTNICVGNCISFSDLSIGGATSWSWTFTGGTPGTSTTQNPTSICYNTAGTYAVSMTATNSHGSNTATKTTYITVSGPSTLPFVENFEGATFPPTGWFVVSPDTPSVAWGTDGIHKWERQAAAGNAGSTSGSAAINYYNYNTDTTQIDDLISKPISLSGATNPSMTFKRAYKYYPAVLNYDELRIYVSTDCGVTYGSPVYYKKGVQLATNGALGTTFTPSVAADWDIDTVSLLPYAGQNIIVKFSGTNKYGNNLYLDDINITNVVATASVVISQTTGTDPMCAGATATFTAVPTNGGTTPSYQWKVNGTNVGTNSPTYTTTTLTTGQIVTCVMTSSLTGVAGSPATSNSITMTVNPIPATPTAGSNSPVCAGSTINLTTPTVASSTYSWTGPSTFTSTTQNPSRTSATAAMAGTYSVTVTTAGCISAAGTTAVVVNAVPATPTATATTPVCTGNTISFTTPTVTGATYAWTGPSSFTSTSQNPTRTGATTVMAGTYSVTVTKSGCTSAAGTTPAVVVNTTPATPTAGSNSPVCTGSALNLTTPTLTGATYAWTGPATFTSTSQNPTRTGTTVAMAGTYTVIVTSSAGCPSAAGTTAVVVNTTPATPTASNTGPYCAGATIALSTPALTGATYAWTGPSTFTSTTQNPTRPTSTTAMAGTYSVTVTKSGCTSTAGTTTVVVNPVPATPTASNTGPYCVGSTITLSTPTVAGTTYAWTGPSTFTSATQNPTRTGATTAMAGTYSVTVTTSGCTSTAGTTAVVVNTSVTPSVSAVASPTGAICSGTSVTFTATPAGGGTTPSYQWQVNGSNVGTNSPTYTSSTLTNGQIVTCILTSSSSCASPATATSSGITMTVTPTVTPTITISIASGTNPTCSGASIMFMATITNGGSTPAYQWKVNGANAGTNLATFTSSTLANGDVVTCTLTSSATCASPASLASAGITMTVNPTPATPTITQAGSVLTSSSATGNQWYLNGVLIAGATSQNYTVTANGTYTVVVTVGSCSSATSAPLVVINTGIDEAVNPYLFNIYPNPNDGNFNVSFNAPERSTYVVELTNALGQLIFKDVLTDYSGIYTKQLSVVDYGKGIYTISLTNSKKETVKKIIVY